MRIPRCFIDQPLEVDTTIRLPTETGHYVHTVLRLDTGNRIVLFNGLGGEYNAVLTLEGRTRCARILGYDAREVESSIRIHLAPALAKGEKLDWVMQKATELGIAEISPIATARCEMRLAADRRERKLEHWRQIVVHACAQCGRNRIPTVHMPVSLEAWLPSLGSIAGDTTRLVLSPLAGTATLTSIGRPEQHIVVVVGPEGGLTDAEEETLRATGFSAVTLGPRILRAETAACAAVAALQTLWGDLSGSRNDG